MSDTTTTPANAARAAIAAAEAAFQHATKTCDAIQFSNLAVWVIRDLIIRAVEAPRARIQALAQQLTYGPAADQADSMYQSMIAAANDQVEICRRLADPATMRDDLRCLYSASAPGHMGADHFRSSTAQQDEVERMVAEGKQRVAAGAAAERKSALEHLGRLRAQGVIVDAVDGDLRITGPVSGDDFTLLKVRKSVILAAFAEAVTL